MTTLEKAFAEAAKKFNKTIDTSHNARKTDKDVIIEVVSVTKVLATMWLDTQANNRNLSPKTVTAYARDMKKGAWRFDGTPIRFNRSGNLIDGQHRLSAIIESGKTQKMVVMWNLANETQDVMDSGRSRNIGDTLKLHGYKNWTALGSSARMLRGILDKATGDSR